MIKIVCIGKIKENYIKEALTDYYARLSKYTKLKIIELESVPLNNKDQVLVIERDKIAKYITKKDYIITLEIEGTVLNSIELSRKIDQLFSQGYSNITFVIGGSYGLSDDIKQQADCSLSFSQLTFPHQLFRIILLEQLYRSFKIINNETYHK